MKILFTIAILFTSSAAFAQLVGCPDPLALNYSTSAIINDGSCLYAPAIATADTSFILNDTVVETSGLIQLNNYLWTHNDNTDLHLYALDTTNGAIVSRDTVVNGSNIDMEEISQDSLYIYLGDFGNNANGNRQNLVIYRILKDSLFAHNAVVDTIAFSYADQTNFNPQGAFNTDFDCEAFIVTDDSIFLFTKQWIGHQCTVYSMPKAPGTYVAERRATYDVQGLTTGATYVKNKDLVVLIGYTPLLQPWFLMLYDYAGTDFFSGNKRMLTTSIGTSQTEGISSSDGLKFFVTNEKRTISTVIIPQQLHIFDLSMFTGNYVNTSFEESLQEHSISIFPNPTSTAVNLTLTLNHYYLIQDISGKTVTTFLATSTQSELDVSSWTNGVYFLIDCSTGKSIGQIVR